MPYPEVVIESRLPPDAVLAALGARQPGLPLRPGGLSPQAFRVRTWPDGRFLLAVRPLSAPTANPWRPACEGRVALAPGGGSRVTARFDGVPAAALPGVAGACFLIAAVAGAVQRHWLTAAGTLVAGVALTVVTAAVSEAGTRAARGEVADMTAVLAHAAGAEPAAPAA